MAWAPAAVHVTQATVNTGSAVTTTNGGAYKPGDLYILLYAVSKGTPFTDTTTFTLGTLTWTKILGKISGNDQLGAFIGYGTSNASDTSQNGTLTFSGTPTSGRYVMLVLPNGAAAGSNPVIASTDTSGTGNAPSMTLSSVDPSNSGGAQSRLSIWMTRVNEAQTVDATGATWLEDLDLGNNTSIVWHYQVQRLEQVKDDTNTSAWTTSAFYAGWMAQLSAAHTAKLYSEEPKVVNRSAVSIGLDDDVWAVV